MIIPKLERVQRRYLTSKRIREQEKQESLHDETQQRDSGLKSWLPRLVAWLKPERIEAPDKSFLPCPKITFLVDEPRNLVCTICKITPLTLQSDDEDSQADNTRCSDVVPAIMPCGHIAGAACLSNWFEEHDTCPFCRCRLVYSKCGHQVPVRLMTKKSIFLVPATIPEGGVIPDLCLRCQEEELRRTAEIKFGICKRRFRLARAQFQLSSRDCEARVLLERKVELEKCMLEEFHVKAMRAWLGNW